MKKVQNCMIVCASDLTEKEDVIISEFPLTLFINEKEYATLLCTPDDMDLLVLGFLLTEQLIEKKSDVLSLVIDEDKGLAFIEIVHTDVEQFRMRYITSGCASSAVYYKTLDAVKLRFLKLEKFPVELSDIFDNMMVLNQSSDLFKSTGGVHSAGVFEKDQLLVMKEDIGRHNAVDKVIGHMIKNNITSDHKVMYISGRISSEMVLKCVKNRISVIVSKSAPTSTAIKIADMHDMILMGFVRGRKGNIYCGSKRIEV